MVKSLNVYTYDIYKECMKEFKQNIKVEGNGFVKEDIRELIFIKRK